MIGRCKISGMLSTSMDMFARRAPFGCTGKLSRSQTLRHNCSEIPKLAKVQVLSQCTPHAEKHAHRAAP